MWNRFSPRRFTLLKTFIFLYLFVSLVVRVSLFIWDFGQVDKGVFDFLKIFLIGTFFDLGTVSLFVMPYLIYLVLVPRNWYGSILDKVITYLGFFIGVLIIYFSFFGEFTFWEEFHRRYNFIAVDYLIYTYEVVRNIHESYPLPILISSLLILVALTIYLVYKVGAFKETFYNQTAFGQKVWPSVLLIAIAIFFSLFISNDQAEWSSNRYNSELSKSGIYSFFAAFRNNELSYTEFYKTIPTDKAFSIVKSSYSAEENSTLLNPKEKSLLRKIIHSDSTTSPLRPNVIFICIESLSGGYLNFLGGDYNITPVLDSLANESICFTNLFATGTRTVRGMEAITLSIPPTPGRSIVKRKNNMKLFTIGKVFENQGYERNFFYGGDGYFDNMNSYFGGNGFNIIDRGRGFLLEKGINTVRTNIEDEEVTFENAWGVCDEDVYSKVIKEADKAHKTGKPFFDFVMTTSNHKPYTYPENKIDIPSGTGRRGAIKYTDYAIGQFLKIAKTKPWFDNTVFVIMSDHCASSAGKWELDVKNYHIPALIFNLPNTNPHKIDKLCSQIDMFPTLFGLLHWDYTSNLFGKDVLMMRPSEERAFIGNYRKLGYLKGNKVMVLGNQKKANFYNWNRESNNLTILPVDNDFLEKTISFYQVADYLYSNNGLKIKE